MWSPKKLGLEGWARVEWLSLIGAQNLPKRYLGPWALGSGTTLEPHGHWAHL